MTDQHIKPATWVNDHPFDAAHLDDVLARTLPVAPIDARLVWGGAVDQTGVKAAVAWTIDQKGQWQVKAAFEYDWTHDKRFAIGGSFTPK
jgi:hypothetical protein